MTGAAAPSFPLFAPATAADRRPLIVSIHDVAPATRDASAEMLRQLAQRGVDVCSLLVVPNYHSRGLSVNDRAFVGWLRNLEAAGHEIVIHGYFHQRARQTNETLRARLVTRSYTSDEGEFYDLEYDEALGRITRAREEFESAGLKPRGFIAPAWLLSVAAEKAAADAEMEYTTRLTSVLDLRTRQSFHSRSMVYSVRSSWRRAASLAWNGTLAQLQSANELVRLGVHPPDLNHPLVWSQILRVAERLTSERTPTTYRDWIGERRL